MLSRNIHKKTNDVLMFLNSQIDYNISIAQLLTSRQFLNIKINTIYFIRIYKKEDILKSC